MSVISIVDIANLMTIWFGILIICLSSKSCAEMIIIRDVNIALSTSMGRGIDTVTLLTRYWGLEEFQGARNVEIQDVDCC